jgi:DNA polymerase IV
VTLKVKYADFRLATRSRTLPASILSREELAQAATDLAAPVFPSPEGVRLLGVSLSALETVAGEPPRQLKLDLISG